MKDHGVWRRYYPPVPPNGAPRNAMFLKRDGDDFDWYEYANVEEGNEHHKDRKVQFDKASVKCVVETVKEKDGKDVAVIRAAAVDAPRLFPDGCRIIELTEILREQDEDALIKEFSTRRINIKTGVLGEKWKPAGPEPRMDERVADALEMILARLEKLEGKENGNQGDR